MLVRLVRSGLRPSPGAVFATCLLVALGCDSAPSAPESESDARRRAGEVGDCGSTAVAPTARSPASSDPSLRTIDDEFVAIARSVPGGFAGIYYDDGRPVIMLTDPAHADAVRAAVAAAFVGFPAADAELRRVKWDFGQLYDWYIYLIPIAWQSGVPAMSDIEEVQNRIYFGTEDEAARARLRDWLSRVDLPCDLVYVDVVGVFELLDH